MKFEILFQLNSKLDLDVLWKMKMEGKMGSFDFLAEKMSKSGEKGQKKRKAETPKSHPAKEKDEDWENWAKAKYPIWPF